MSKTLNGYLITKFTRKIKLCDNSNEDLDIVPGVQTVIYAWSSEQPQNDQPAQHTYRSSCKMQLISSINQVVALNANQLEKAEFLVDVYK